MSEEYMRPEIVSPVIRLNGSSAKVLIANLEKAYDAVNAAYKVLKEISPHGRDYYVVEGLFDKARVQHDHRLLGLHHIMDSLEEEVKGIYAQTRQ